MRFSHAMGLVLFALPLWASAQSDSVKLIHRVGDVTVYQVEQKSDNKTTEETVTVAAVEGALIRSRHVRAEQTRDGTITDTAELVLSGSSGSVYDPPLPFVRGPLQVGTTWKTKHKLVSANQARSEIELESRIVAVEKLNTPAGAFDTVKIESGGWITGVSWSGALRMAQVSWFAPSLGRMVRQEFRSFRDGRPHDHVVQEIKSFKAAP